VNRDKKGVSSIYDLPFTIYGSSVTCPAQQYKPELSAAHH
jgi:hypothetical protein